MNKKILSFIIQGFLMVVVLSYTVSCGKSDIPELTSLEATDIKVSLATSGGIITSDGGDRITARGVCWSANEAPKITDSKTLAGRGTGEFYCKITGLLPETKYFVRAFAQNKNGTGYGNTFSFTTRSGFIDLRDGNGYKTVIIGDQEWMAENLKYLPSVSFGVDSETLPYYYVCGYRGTNTAEAMTTTNYDTYGVLYNWPAVMAGSTSSNSDPSGVQGVCPDGWHLPSDAEWTQLIDYLGGDNVAGAKLKEAGTLHWGYNKEATNETGFTALPGSSAQSCWPGSSGLWWSATESNPNSALARMMEWQHGKVRKLTSNKERGYSVRCIKNE